MYIFVLDEAYKKVYLLDRVPRRYIGGKTGAEVMRYRALYNYKHIYHSEDIKRFSPSQTKYHEGRLLRNYGTGSRRDSREGKGRYDLISPHATKRLALRLEFGVEKYGERNWEKGQPMDDFFDSAKRHMDNWQMGMTDEDHLAAAYWNLHCMIHFDTLDMSNEIVTGNQLWDKVNDCWPWNLCECPGPVSKDAITCSLCAKKLPKSTVILSNPSQTASKPLLEKDEETPRPLATNGLEGNTGRQNLYDQHEIKETTEMIRRELYREEYRHAFPQVNEQLTLEGLVQYD